MVQDLVTSKVPTEFNRSPGHGSDLYYTKRTVQNSQSKQPALDGCRATPLTLFKASKVGGWARVTPNSTALPSDFLFPVPTSSTRSCHSENLQTKSKSNTSVQSKHQWFCSPDIRAPVTKCFALATQSRQSQGLWL